MACVLQASDGASSRIGFAGVGKCRDDESGKHPVNEQREGTATEECGSFAPSCRGALKTRTSDAQLRIGESRDSGFIAARCPGMTVERDHWLNVIAITDARKQKWPEKSRPFQSRPLLRVTPGSPPSCRARPARLPIVRSERGRASTRRSRARSRGRTPQTRDRRRVRRRCRP